MFLNPHMCSAVLRTRSKFFPKTKKLPSNEKIGICIQSAYAEIDAKESK